MRIYNLPLIFISALLATLPVEGTAALRNILIFGSLISFLIFIHQKKLWGKLQFPLKWLWFSYGAIALLNQIWAIDPIYSWHEFRHEILIGALIFWISFNLFIHTNNITHISTGLFLSNIFLVTFTLFAWALGKPTKDGLFGSFQTGVGNYTTYLIMVFPLLILFFFNKKTPTTKFHQAIFGVFILGNIVAMYATQNRQVIVALGAELIVATYLFKHNLKIRVMLIAGFCALLLLFLGFATQMMNRGSVQTIAEATQISNVLESDGRLPRWKFAISESLLHPLTGGGFGRMTFKHLYPDHPMTDGRFVHSHNMVVNRLIQLGIPGMFAFLALLCGIPVLLWSKKENSRQAYWLAVTGTTICIGVLTKNMTDDFFMRELGYFYWLTGGILLGLQSRECQHQLAEATPETQEILSRFPPPEIGATG